MPFDAAPQTVKADCLVCPVQTCLARSANCKEADAWTAMLAARQPMMPGSGALSRCGDPLRNLYSVRGGCLKSYTVDADGNERIRGFYLPGDLVGLDVMAGGSWLSNVGAVVPSQVCVVPLAELRPLMSIHPGVAMRMLEQTSRELALALAVSGDYSAEQRLAAFLLRMRARLECGDLIRLPMPQRDVGNYLRLATETVCRTLKSLERRGCLSLADKAIHIVDEAALCALADPVGIECGASFLPKAA